MSARGYDHDDDSEDGMLFRDQLSFFGVKVDAGKPFDVEFSDAVEEMVHLTQASGGGS